MPRQPRNLQPGYCYHVTTRCNNRRRSPGQMKLWDEWEADEAEVRDVAEKFVRANAYDPDFAVSLFDDS